MSKLKPISRESIPRALEKAERYRLLNEPFFAESICLDILAVDADDQRALATYVLALSDQVALGVERAAQRATAAIERLRRDYDRLYYRGIVSERRAEAILERGLHGMSGAAWHHLDDAMAFYEKADAAQPDQTNDDAILRYNTCVRLIEAHHLTEPARDEESPLE